MLTKILGLLLIIPFLAALLCSVTEDEESKKLDDKAKNKRYLSACVFVLMVEAFGVGIYFIFWGK